MFIHNRQVSLGTVVLQTLRLVSGLALNLMNLLERMMAVLVEFRTINALQNMVSGNKSFLLQDKCVMRESIN